ncbi:MAG: metallophosphoesterase [bacterium]|nr:MAG: metallophosphoesterase [bacterium]
MSIFLIIFLSIYGSMNAYFFWRFQHAYHLQGLRLIGLVVFLLVMVTGPILVRLLERAGLHLPATGLAYIVYIWMAVALWFLAFGLVLNAWNLVIRTAARAVPATSQFVVGPAAGFRTLAFVVILLIVWGSIEARNLRVERLSIRTDLLPAGSQPLRIAQISDVHLGMIEGRGRVRQISRVLRETDPDVLVSTGDLVDGFSPHLDHLSTVFSDIKPPLGKFAVTGNHEFYAGLDHSLDFHHRSGFEVLRGQSRAVGELLTLAGVDDPAGRQMDPGIKTDESQILPAPKGERFTVLLKHRPWIGEGMEGRFDLQLSGHTHRGQIFPFHFLVRLEYPFLSGLYQLEKGSAIFTSRGTGTWGPPLRVLSPPEVTIITIEPAKPVN